MAKLGL